MTVREKFCKKIYDEYAGFQKEMLRKDRADIYGEAYRIDILINLYEILLDKAETLPDAVLRILLQRSSLLETVYDRWLKKADGAYEELVQHVEEELMKSAESLAG